MEFLHAVIVRKESGGINMCVISNHAALLRISTLVVRWCVIICDFIQDQILSASFVKPTFSNNIKCLFYRKKLFEREKTNYERYSSTHILLWAYGWEWF